MLDIDFVITIHNEIVDELGGLHGFGGSGIGGLEAALHRVEARAYYEGLNDVFLVAALYAVAIARGHVFNDGNKRTGLTCALTYLESQGFIVETCPALEDIMVEVADGRIDQELLAKIFSFLWTSNEPVADN